MLPEGAARRRGPGQADAETMLGHVTSSYFSPTLGRSIAMALIVGGRGRKGQTLHVPMPDGTLTARVVAGTVFYDPEGKRLSA